MCLVSIIIPYYNDGATINEAVHSALEQTHANLEIIIVDDGSDVSVNENLEKSIKAAGNVQCIFQVNQGLAAARNFGVTKSSGKYLVFLDADDKLAKTYVEDCLKVHEDNQQLQIVYSESEKFGRETGRWELPEFNMKSFLSGNCIPAFAMVKKATFIELGCFDPNVKYLEDWDLWIRAIAKYGVQIYRIPKILHFYRKRENNDSLTDLNIRSKQKIAEKNLLYIFYKNFDFFEKEGFRFNLLLEDNLYFRTAYNDLRKKYYSIWYKKMFYKLKGKKPWLDIQ